MELFVWLTKEISSSWKKISEEFEEFKQKQRKTGFFFVFEYVEIKNFKILKKKPMEHLQIVYLIR